MTHARLSFVHCMSPVLAQSVDSLRRNDTSGVGGKPDMSRTLLKRRD